MDHRILRYVGLAVVLAGALPVPGRALSSAPTKLQGTIHDNADALGANWDIAGEWSLTMQGASGKADFFASLTMKHNGPVPGAPHTHHLSLKGATVTTLANGYSVTGIAAIAGNGSLANLYTGSEVTVEVTGGSDLPLSNVKVTFHGEQAVNHFGTDPLNGVVVYRP
jgi:hypothetical protein